MGIIKHSGFLSSQGVNGWYTTQIDNEIIKFKWNVNSLQIEADTTTLLIKIDSNTDLWYIDANDCERIESLLISQIQVMLPAGTKLRWKALFY